jgi:hypothetical protein
MSKKHDLHTQQAQAKKEILAKLRINNTLKPIKPKKPRKHSAGWVIKSWRNIRERILRRDEWRCRICCKTISDDPSLNVHHKDWDRQRNQDDNLVTLCGACHRAIHREGYKPSMFEDYPEPWNKYGMPQ